MHIHMEIGRVISVRMRDSKTKNQPQMPMLKSAYCKAVKRKYKCRNRKKKKKQGICTANQ